MLNHKRSIFLLSSLFGALSVTTAARADGLLTPYTVFYTLNLDNKLSGTATRELKILDKTHFRYITRASAALLASAQESSDFELNAEGRIRPLHYRLERHIFFSHRQTDLTFDWPHDILVTQTESDSPRHFPLPPDTLDKLCLEIQMRMDISHKNHMLTYQLADADGIKEYQYTLDGQETLDTPIGKMDVLRLERVHSADTKRFTTFWIAPKLNFLPVKVVQQEDGAHYDLLISRIGRNDASPATAESVPLTKDDRGGE